MAWEDSGLRVGLKPEELKMTHCAAIALRRARKTYF
jgi:hypothetical protein